MEAKNAQETIRMIIEEHVPALVASGVEIGKTRLQNLEEQAQEIMRELRERSTKEMDTLKERLPVDDVKERINLDEMSERARALESETRGKAESLMDEVERRFHKLQTSLLELAGVASQEQVASLATEMEKLSKRMDKLARQRKKAAAAKSATAAKSASKATGERGA